MGYLTTIVIHNDALDTFKKYPTEFAEAIFEGMNKANEHQSKINASFHEYGNYITIHPSRHSDDETVYLHTGNTVTQLNNYSKDFQELAKRNPKLAKDFIKRAQKILKNAAIVKFTKFTEGPDNNHV